MKKDKLGAGFFSSIILTLGIMSIFAGITYAYDLKEYYPLNEGDTWTYSTTKNDQTHETVIKVEGKEMVGEAEGIKMVSSEGNYDLLTIDAEGVILHKNVFSAPDGTRSGYVLHNPPQMLFVNLEIGQTKEYKSTSEGVYGPGDPALTENGVFKITLDSVEDIEVKAGKFPGCLKFSSDYTYSEKSVSGSEGHGGDKCTAWLAPGLGMVKSICSSTEYSAKDNSKDEYTIQEELISSSLIKVPTESREAPVSETPSEPKVEPQAEAGQNQ